ncbi:MAG: 2-isopropylmalate synthase [Elusimicrobia bacterium]|nr:2-isopropylmalate synthase [Elusimicrobiota bacterium]MBU2614728.1 2-isopropylmalate synthase [Elusimicrobiota bacterium]
MKNKIIIFDTTLRDGEQSPGASLNVEQKIEIAHQLARLGVDVMEAGFPISSPGDFEAVKAVAKEVKGPIIAGLARTIEKDIEVCGMAIKPAKRGRIHTFIATSDIHLRYKLKKSREEVLEIAKRAVKYARKFTDDVEFSAEDAGRSDFDYLCKIVEETINAGATTINIPDTVGYAIPNEFGSTIRRLIERVPNIHKAVLSVHCHNDLGLSTANSISAVINGARQVECTINGIGERAGNCSLEEVVMILKTRQQLLKSYGIILPGIDTTQIYKTSKLVSSLTGISVQPNKAIVGSNAFAHEAGIHQDGVLKKSLTYEIMTPHSVGVPSNNLVLGKHSGRHAFSKRLAELGLKVDSKNIDSLFAKFKELTDKKKCVFDEDIAALAEEKLAGETELFKLEYFHTSSGSGVIPTATVKLGFCANKKNISLQEAAYGDGPVDAAYHAIDKIVSKELKWKSVPKLIDYTIHAVSGGKDALGEVIVKANYSGMTFTGRGSSTDIIEASIKSYLNVINKIAHAKFKKGSVKPI